MSHAGLPTLTKIIATIGPASSNDATVTRLIESGVSVFRLNYSHGDADQHAAHVRVIRVAAERCEQPVAILGDLPGPKIRIGAVAGEGVTVPSGAQVILQGEPTVAADRGEPYRFSTTYRDLVNDVAPGQRVLINDGAVRLLILDRRDGEIHCTTITGGLVSSGKGVNLPDTVVSAATLTDRDWDLVSWTIREEVDYLAQSFVRTAADVRTLDRGVRERLQQAGKGDLTMPIIAKIETPTAVDQIDGIVAAADGIMVARGDLGVEMDLARVPVVQKDLIQMAQAHGKPCIVATQMLESMITSPSPTRAEASDVATAIVDGADSVMLSGETAVGKHPVLAVQTMKQVALHTEAYLASLPRQSAPPRKLLEAHSRIAALAHGAWTIARDLDARIIVIWSQSGEGARHLSQNDFCCPIFAFSSDPRALRQMQLLRSVVPLHMEVPESLAQFTAKADQRLLEVGWARRDDLCLHIAGAPLGSPDVTSSIAIHRVADPQTGFAGRTE